MKIISLLFICLACACSVSLDEAYQCWGENIAHPLQIREGTMNNTRKFQFSLHESVGHIIEVQKNATEPIFIGDFSTVRVYSSNNKISVYEGMMLRVATPAPHIFSDSSEISMEIQILHKLYYGKYDYEYIGVSHIFRASEEMNGKDTGLWKQLTSLQKGDKFSIDKYHPLPKSENVRSF